MASSFSDIVEEARLSARALLDYGDNLFNPTIRLGVTGLSRAGKTVFITALVHGLTRGGRFPVFEPLATGRIARARLEPQPDDAVPRFDYENHVRTLIEERRWPNSTVDISELRLVIDYQRQNGADRTLTLDIVDYPGEWLLDLPLLNKSYQQWSAESLALSRQRPRARLAAPWHAHLATLNAEGPDDEQAALAAARLFTDYLRACRDERFAMSLLPPGRFLMPGNLAGSPALTFAPLDVPADGAAPEGSLWAMMVRRYEAYKDVVVRPVLSRSFLAARSPDRAGRCAGGVQRRAGSAASTSRRHWPGSWTASGSAAARCSAACSGRGSTASCSPPPRPIICTIRAMTGSRRCCGGPWPRRRRAPRMPAPTSTWWHWPRCAPPARRRCSAAAKSCPRSWARRPPARVANGESFDGETEVATFPGDLPADPEALFGGDGGVSRACPRATAEKTDFRFLRFRPPQLEGEAEGPHCLTSALTAPSSS